MISPSGLKLPGPGIFIPVFFLSLWQVTLSGQVQWPGTASAAMGGSFVCLEGPMSSRQNQAGLGYTDHSSISIQHARPFLLKELGISSLSGQFRTGKGALGMSLSTLGIKGLKQSSLWLAYGQRLFSHLSAGVGLHFWNYSIQEQFLYAPGMSFALGLQIRIREHWKLGARIFHPAVWNQRSQMPGEKFIQIETGFGYSFFNAASLYTELHIHPGSTLSLCGGAEWILNRQIKMRIGIRSEPFTYSWGLSLRLKKCIAEFSFSYRAATGLSPHSALIYEW
jgi:hypothetical protein